MEILGNIIMVVGIIAILIGGIWTLLEQFRSGILWLLACIFIPFVGLIWLATHWEEGKRPFALALVGALVTFGGLMLSGHPIAGTVTR
jgi:FtsH-binding integral membrane protein